MLQPCINGRSVLNERAFIPLLLLLNTIMLYLQSIGN